MIRYADTTPSNDLLRTIFLKINLLVRLWKKLGWTIDEIDQAIKAFLPTKSVALASPDLGLALQTTLVYMSHLKEMDDLVDIGENSLFRLLSIWSTISTRGKSALYDQLFLTPNAQGIDPIFDDPLGNYLSSTAGIYVKDHLLSLQACA